MSPTTGLDSAERLIIYWLSEMKHRSLGTPASSQFQYNCDLPAHTLRSNLANAMSSQHVLYMITTAIAPQAEKLLLYSYCLPSRKTKASGGKWVAQVHPRTCRKHLNTALWHRCRTQFPSLLYLRTKLMFYYRHWWLGDSVAFAVSGSSPTETNTLRCQKNLFHRSPVHLFISVNLSTLLMPIAVYMGNKLSIYQHFKIFPYSLHISLTYVLTFYHVNNIRCRSR